MHNITDEEFTLLLGRPLPAGERDKSIPIGYSDTIGQCREIKGFGRFVCRFVLFARWLCHATGKPVAANNVMLIMNLRFNQHTRMSSGFVNMPMLDGRYTGMVNGRFWQGLKQVNRVRREKRKQERIYVDGQGHFDIWKQQHETVWQFIMFMLMSGITTLVDLESFALFNFLAFALIRDREFSFWLIDYSLENGGQTAFFALACSFTISQTFNFFLQRKTTFKAENSMAKSAAMYVVMVIVVYFLQLYLPTLIRAPIAGALGAALGDIVVKMINMTVSMLIQFFANKWLIMKR